MVAGCGDEWGNGNFNIDKVSPLLSNRRHYGARKLSLIFDF